MHIHLFVLRLVVLLLITLCNTLLPFIVTYCGRLHPRRFHCCVKRHRFGWLGVNGSGHRGAHCVGGHAASAGGKEGVSPMPHSYGFDAWTLHGRWRNL